MLKRASVLGDYFFGSVQWSVQQGVEHGWWPNIKAKGSWGNCCWPLRRAAPPSPKGPPATLCALASACFTLSAFAYLHFVWSCCTFVCICILALCCLCARLVIGPRSPGPIYVSGSQWVSEWVSKLRLWNFTDVTLADEDTNSILTDKVNRTIQCNVAMQV